MYVKKNTDNKGQILGDFSKKGKILGYFMIF